MFFRSFQNQHFTFLVSRDEGEAVKINDWNSAIQVDCQHVKNQTETGKELSENLCCWLLLIKKHLLMNLTFSDWIELNE